jgi:hypothetical protein
MFLSVCTLHISTKNLDLLLPPLPSVVVVVVWSSPVPVKASCFPRGSGATFAPKTLDLLLPPLSSVVVAVVVWSSPVPVMASSFPRGSGAIFAPKTLDLLLPPQSSVVVVVVVWSSPVPVMVFQGDAPADTGTTTRRARRARTTEFQEDKNGIHNTPQQRVLADSGCLSQRN